MPKYYFFGGICMNTKTKHGCRRMLAMLLVIVSVMSLFAVPAVAGQEDGYDD